MGTVVGNHVLFASMSFGIVASQAGVFESGFEGGIFPLLIGGEVAVGSGAAGINCLLIMH